MTAPVTPAAAHCATGSAAFSHHWVLGVGDLRPELRATADLLGVELTEVGC